MARKKQKSKSLPAVLFNVVYEDGSLSSNRRVAGEQMDDKFGEDPLALARTVIEDQDNQVAQKSGVRKAKIKSITRVAERRQKDKPGN